MRGMLFLAMLFFLLGAGLGACAPTTQRVAIDPGLAAKEAEKQRQIALTEFRKTNRHLFAVSYPILVGGASFCEDKIAPMVGASVSNLYSYPEEFRSAAKVVFDETKELRIALIAPNTPADRAGLRARDVLVRINGTPVPSGEDASKAFSKLYDEAAKGKKSFTLAVRRGEDVMDLTITPDMGCDYPVLLANDDQLNAFADGQRIVIMRGMVRFAENDTELGTVVAHELAHNAMKHISAKQNNAMLGLFADILASVGGVNTQGTFSRMGAGIYSQDFEAEADYVGLYIMALSGLEIEGAPHFWRRMAAAHPQAIQQGGFLASHPSTPERFLALEKTVAEIKQKQAAGQKLRPEMKK